MSNKSILSKIPNFFDAIKFQESIFALPFAYIGMLLSIQNIPSLEKFIWITLAMVSARTVGMIANRVIDRHIDSKNPRAAQRHLPQGILSVTDLLIPGVLAAIFFIACAYMLNAMAFILAPLALLYLITYPLTKRFTWAANLLLGWALAIAPSAAWIGMVGKLDWQPVLLSTAVALWAGSFDIIYHTQDVVFRMLPELATAVRPESKEGAKAFLEHLDTPNRVVLKLTPEYKLDFDSSKMWQHRPDAAPPGRI